MIVPGGTMCPKCTGTKREKMTPTGDASNVKANKSTSYSEYSTY